ncbi:MAG TPA: RNA methyltransferase [Ignavibacteria bacterium]
MTKNEIKYFVNLKKKEFRDSEDIFLIEGTHLIGECLSSKYYKNNLTRIFITSNYKNVLLEKLKTAGFAFEVLQENIFNKLSETKNPQGIIAVVKINVGKIFTGIDVDLAIALDNINDPGNLGTILRTCWWFGVNKIFISSNSVDLFNSKVIRGSQGALFNLDISTNIDLNKTLKGLSNIGWKLYATDLKANKYLDEIDFGVTKKNIFVFGNEANGISTEILSNPLFKKIKIKGHSSCESLNIGVSVGIVLDYILNRKLKTPQ